MAGSERVEHEESPSKTKFIPLSDDGPPTETSAPPPPAAGITRYHYIVLLVLLLCNVMNQVGTHFDYVSSRMHTIHVPYPSSLKFAISRQLL